MVKVSSPFQIDWTDLEAVKEYAQILASKGPSQAVIKFPERNNYNITFASRVNEHPEAVTIVVYAGRLGL